MPIDDRVTLLEDELQRLRDQLAALELARAGEAPANTSRRGALKLALATAVGAVGSTALAGRAAADNGLNLTSTTAATTLVFQGSSPAKPGFLFLSNIAGPSALTWPSSALAGVSLSPASNAGVFGYSSQLQCFGKRV